MIHTDHFVGGVSAVLGVVLLAAAALNWPWCYRLTKIRWIEAVCGRIGVRLILALLGVGLIVLGLAIATDVGGRRASAATHHRVTASPHRRVSAATRRHPAQAEAHRNWRPSPLRRIAS